MEIRSWLVFFDNAKSLQHFGYGGRWLKAVFFGGVELIVEVAHLSQICGWDGPSPLYRRAVGYCGEEKFVVLDFEGGA